MYKWVLAKLMLWVPCNGLASQPGGVEILLMALCFTNQQMLQPDGPLGLGVQTLSLSFTLCVYLHVKAHVFFVPH